MSSSFKHVDLKLIRPNFDSELIDVLFELNHLRKLELSGTTAPWMFFQLKEIFHLFESVGSARIEGNRTTISEYVEKKIEHGEHSNDRFSEIANVEEAMSYIEKSIDQGTEITHQFIRELHHLAVDSLVEEGDRTPGSYRNWNVAISQSQHLPPEHHRVQLYMEELLEFINKQTADKYDLIKVAISHHRFTWIHPFGNGNGRVVRLLTYALLIKYGFNVKTNKILNPTAVFCSDRNKYYEMLSIADESTDDGILSWCEYVLKGILEEITKVNKLTDHNFLVSNFLIPAIELGFDRGYITKSELLVLRLGVAEQEFKSSDLDKLSMKLTSRQKSHMISKLKQNNLIVPLKKGGRSYYVNFMNNYLMRSLVRILEKNNFIPSID